MEILLVLSLVGAIAPMVAYGLLGLFDGFPRLQLRQVAGIIAAVAWVFGLFAQQWVGPYLSVTALPMILVYFATWRGEFRRLMARSDDEFPGRFDKVGWFLMLTLAAPVGIWFFRSYRRARWPEPGETPKARARSSPWDDGPEMTDGALAGAGVGRVDSE